MYAQYKLAMKGKDKKVTEKLKADLTEQYDKKYPYEKIVLLRTIATKKFEFDQK